ncbi:MAG: hypothetical protein IH582_03020 [Afipia sp.]|nr:hypothetical protein [Afipia sp.]
MRNPVTIAIVFLAAGVVGFVAAFPHLIHRALESRNGPGHVFAVSGRLLFLDEEVALDRARTALQLDGFTNEVWEPAKDGRTTAPDGRPDVYLARNTENPHRGMLMFTNQHGAQAFVVVEIDATSLTCQRVVGK